MSLMKGIILSGGKGSRLAPITDNYPKQLVPVIGKPILFHCIETLKKADITEIQIVLNPETGKLIEEKVHKENFGVNISFLYQDAPKGLAHAIGINREFTGDDDFTVILGDNIFDEPLSKMVNKFYANKADSLILIKEVDRPYDFGVVTFDANGRAQSLVEKPKTFVSKHAIVGVYLFNKTIYKFIDKIEPSLRGELEITDAIAAQVESKANVITHILDSFWFDSGTREGLLDANKTLLIESNKFDNVDSTVRDSYLHGNISVKEKTIIEGSNLMGPIFIGKNVKIYNSTLGPFTAISDNCVIENSEIQDSIVMENTMIRDSMLISSVMHHKLDVNGKQLIINKLYADS